MAVNIDRFIEGSIGNYEFDTAFRKNTRLEFIKDKVRLRSTLWLYTYHLMKALKTSVG